MKQSSLDLRGESRYFVRGRKLRAHWPEIGPTMRAAIFVVTQEKKVLSSCQLYTCFLNTEATFSVNFS